MRMKAGTKRKRRRLGGTRKKHHKRNKTINGKMITAKPINDKEFKSLNCSPENKNIKKQFTCFSDDDLHKLRNMWNARHPDLKINSNNSNAP